MGLQMSPALHPAEVVVLKNKEYSRKLALVHRCHSCRICKLLPVKVIAI